MAVISHKRDASHRPRSECGKSSRYSREDLLLNSKEVTGLQQRFDSFLRSKIMEGSDLEIVRLLLADNEGKSLCTVASWEEGNRERPIERMSIPIGREGDIIAEAFHKRQIIAYDGYTSPSKSLQSTPSSDPAIIRSQIYALIPLIAMERVIGILIAERRGKQPFDSATLERLQAFTALVTLTVEHERLSADLQAQIEQQTLQARDLNTLMTITSATAGSLALNEILDQALDTTLACLEMDAGEIFLLNVTHGEVYLVRHRGLEPEAFMERTCFGLGEGIPGRVVQTGQCIIVADLATDQRFLRPAVVAAGFRTFAAFPLVAKGHIVGCFDVAGRQPHRFTEDNLRLLTAVGAAIGMAVANGRIYEDLIRIVKQRPVDAGVTANETVQRLSAQIRFLEHRTEELERMLEDRKVIERAKGTLMARLNLTEVEAMRKLQKESQSRNKKLVEIASIILQAGEII